MENRTMISNRKLALLAGLSLLLMAVIAGFAYGYVFQNIYVANDRATTLRNLINSELLFKLFLVSFVVVLVLDVVVSWSLYQFYKQVNKPLSLITAIFRLIYAALLGISLVNIGSILQLLNNAVPNAVLIMGNFKTFLTIWTFGLVFFGCHLFTLSFLIFKSKFTPKFLGILVLIASVCYIITNSANLVIPGYEKYKQTIDAVLSMPMALGELSLAIWLVFKGGKERKL